MPSSPLGLARAHALVVVVHRDRKRALRGLLAHHVLAEEVEDLARLGELGEFGLGRLRELLVEDLVAQPDALVADVDGSARDELAHLLLRLTAEGALEQVATIRGPSHAALLPWGLRSRLAALRSRRAPTRRYGFFGVAGGWSASPLRDRSTWSTKP